MQSEASLKSNNAIMVCVKRNAHRQDGKIIDQYVNI